MNFNKKVLKFIIIITSFLLLTGCNSNNTNKLEENRLNTPSRIISFAPCITETIFAIGAGIKLVGVTNYCTFPAEAAMIAKIGGYYDPNYEAILRLRPDLAILMSEHAQVIDFMRENSIPHLVVSNHNISAILETITRIGKICGVEKQAARLRDSIETELKFSEKSNVNSLDRKPKVLLCIGRQGIGTGCISKLWAAGPLTFYNELIETAGGENIIKDSLIQYPVLSTESVIRLKPEIIIDVMANMYEISNEKVIQDWKELDMIPAVKNDMLFSLNKKYVNIPGPRIVLLFKDIKEVIEKYKKIIVNSSLHKFQFV
jgi:iron complex transport system substrate-binding protein